LRTLALRLIQICDPQEKAATVRASDPAQLPIGADQTLPGPPGVPGRPQRPLLLPPQQMKPRAVGTLPGRAALIHALTHIEANAINLALDMVWRFDGLPDAF